MHDCLLSDQALTITVCPKNQTAAGSCRKLSSPAIRHPSFFVGLILRGCSLPWPNFGHVVLARPSPILFYPISSTEVSYTGQRCSAVYP